ncbi:hypothetical protein [Aliidiomarina indica]|uniref:hypothetical protein n=1 Tax=Aliidiomarina indica TaxID=2749147 RepID=UPI00188DF996|nr:hypothetical protein [Aliidiomarina indica]
MKYGIKTIATLFALIVIYSMQFTAVANETCQTLLAGQHHNAGTVCVSNDADTVTVTFATNGAWSLLQTHLYVGADASGIPTNRAGNPQIGHFPFGGQVNGSVASYTFNLADFGLGCSDSLAIAAHAVVAGASGTETAWANGTRMVARGNWAMWFTYQAQCPSNPPPLAQTCVSYGTGYAFGNVTFGSVGENGWGWTITNVAPGDSGSATIYANAGMQYKTNDPVGTFSWNYGNNGFFGATFTADAGFGFSDTHLHVGGFTTEVNGRGNYNFNDAVTLLAQDEVHYYGETNGGTVNVTAHVASCKF